VARGSLWVNTCAASDASVRSIGPLNVDDDSIFGATRRAPAAWREFLPRKSHLRKNFFPPRILRSLARFAPTAPTLDGLAVTQTMERLASAPSCVERAPSRGELRVEDVVVSRERVEQDCTLVWAAVRKRSGIADDLWQHTIESGRRRLLGPAAMRGSGDLSRTTCVRKALCGNGLRTCAGNGLYDAARDVCPIGEGNS
jgi:hypothetical protein